VSLDGYLLTDDSTWLTQWVFPDVEIPAGGHLVVWADGDVGQPGLHASFRLNSAGDMVIVGDPDGHVVDRIVFGPQSADISFGRYPDGTGPFVLMDPTPAAPNAAGVGVGGPASPDAAGPVCRVHPNPFATAVTVSYILLQPGSVTLRVYDAVGRLVATPIDAREPAGSHQVEFRPAGPAAAGGVFFAQLSVKTEAGSRLQTIKLVRTR